MKKQKETSEDMKMLVKHVTGIDESDENFQICVSYASSNFKYHRYLSPDSHKIHRAIEGMCEKFEVHSQKQKAIDLKELTSLFLEQTGLDGKECGKTDVHYSLLSMILNLAESPTKTEFHRKKEEIVEEIVDDFDWKKYLLDDEDLNIMSYATSDSGEDEESLPDTYEEDDSEDGEENKRNKIQHEVLLESTLTAPVVKSNSEEQLLTKQAEVIVTDSLRVDMTDEYEELARVLTVEYWKGKSKEEETVGSHAASNLARDWNYYQCQINEFHTPRAQTVVTEFQVIRESLWMLSGITELFIFKYNGKEFRLNPDIYIMHLTTESLENSLRPLMRKATQVSVLQSFVSDIVSQVCSNASAGDGECVPQTYQSFANCVSGFLSTFRMKLCDREKIVMKQEELMSLERLTSDLQPWFAKVQAVHGIYISGIASVSSLKDSSSCSKINNCFKASLLLNTLYQAVFEADLTSLVDEESMACFLLHMLLKSSEPVIQIISDWINNGQLRDPAGEFIVQRNKKIPSLNETFWEKAFVPNIQLMPEEASMLDVTSQALSSQEIPNSSKKASVKSTHGKISGQTSSAGALPELPDMFLKYGPKFLQPVLGDAVLTGKSMEMLENLGRMGQVLDVGYGVYERPPSLYQLFLKDIKSELCTAADNSRSSSAADAFSSSSCKDSTIDKQLNMQGEKDTLMSINFAAIFPGSSSETHDCSKHKSEELTELTHCNLSPLLRLCENCLYPHVRSRYKTVCGKLVHILKTEFHLMECIHAMQRYYLMSSGEVMCDFYTPIFQKIMNREFWRNTSMLELYLHEAVASRFPDDLSKLTVTVSSASSQKVKRPINLTDCIQLKYKVPWPVDVVISGRCQELYNDIFTFLLQIKRAKYSIDQLGFEDLACQQAAVKEIPLTELNEFVPMPRETRIHRFHLLRFRLLYFVNSLHNYIMTRILHSTGLEFASRLEESTDLEQIICVHKQYAEAIHERCLLHPRLSFLKEAVVSVLNLSLTFSTLWRQGVDFVSGDSIQEMETELSRCIHFLSAFLNNVIKRGSFPHLESLAFALVSSLQRANR